MTKSTYTDEEIRQILHSLITEKKRNKELTRQLHEVKAREEGTGKDELLVKYEETLRQLKASDEETNSLREQMQKLKTMIQMANSNSGDQQLVKQLHDSQQHAEQLERVIKFLRGKSEEAHLESKQLEEEYNESQGSLVTLNKELEEAIRNKQELAEELHAIQHQFGELRNQVYTANRECEQAKAALKGTEDRGTNLSQLQQEMETIKSTLQDGLSQAREIERQYLLAVDEKVSAVNQVTQFAKENDQLAEEVRLLKEQMCEAHNREQEVQAETGRQLDQLLRQRDRAMQHSKETQMMNDQLKRENSELKAKNKEYEDRTLRAESQYREQEFEIKTAHQHLAKKVKETTLLSEQIEELKIRLLEIQKGRESERTRLIEMQNRLDLEQQTEKRLEEKLQEARKHIEEQSSKWEEKYFKLCERLQEAETKNKELQGFEEKYNQMQALLANLGNFINKNT